MGQITAQHNVIYLRPADLGGDSGGSLEDIVNDELFTHMRFFRSCYFLRIHLSNTVDCG